MAEIKWIKIAVDLFDDESISLIEQMPEGDSLIVIWFKLLTKAGKINDNGLIYLKESIPYSDEMLSTVLRRPINVIRLALQTFQKLGMIEILDTHELLISNWEKHQNVAGLDRIREQTRKRVAKYREKKKMLIDNNENVTLQVTDNNAIEEDKDIEEDKELDNKNIDRDMDTNCIQNVSTLSEDKSSEPQSNQSIGMKEVKDFVNLYNSIVIRLPKVEKISSTREKKIKARLKNLNLDGWKKVFEKAENSDFCCGINNRGWSVSFDWLIVNDNNYVKVLEGRYDNKGNNAGESKLSELQKKGMAIL